MVKWTTCAIFGALVMACGAETTGSDVEVGDDANLTEAQATRLRVPLVVLHATFFIKPTPIDQSMLGVVLADRVAFADGATSEALPKLETLDHKELAKLPSANVAVGEERYGAIFDVGNVSGQGERLLGKAPPPMLPPDQVHAGMVCRVVGPGMDMYASGPPRVISLEGKIDRVKNGIVTVKSTESTGGDMSLLVCNDKLAGIRAGVGSQGTWHDYHVLDQPTLEAFTKKRDTCVVQGNRCR